MLTYDEAQQRYLEQSDEIEAADAAVRAAALRYKATRTIGRPEVEIEAQLLDFQKTLFLPLGPLADVGAAFGLVDPLQFRIRELVRRPIITATMPIYAGGQMDAARTGAASKLAIEEAARTETTAKGLAQVARAYFARQLAAEARDVRRDVVVRMEQLVADARALEREQQIARAQRLQAEAALEQAKREFEKADGDLAAAEIAVMSLLRLEAPTKLATPLAVREAALPPVEAFVDSALANHPAIRRLDASVTLAGAGVKSEAAQLRPNVYALAQYNLDRQNTLLTDPDFIMGVGIKFKLASGLGRRSQLSAARETEAQASAGAREARNQIEAGVRIAHSRAETARRRHALYARSIAAADESLRVARLSFRELQGTSRDVTDAELVAASARVEQALAAYEYVDALISLMESSGQMERLPDYLVAAGGGQ
ncbi:TolC family protein [Erythrobacter sp. WG]|uniref:TolC family protein n=1 Tax=Erythrobacter sp. WG TaxID=2985510 RepID=UPI00226FBBEF|nr:TolC family protein [Erythrobacter sp. WG]MCX9147325.1 TolC family protein [Erythrobacter sp. WG]